MGWSYIRRLTAAASSLLFVLAITASVNLVHGFSTESAGACPLRQYRCDNAKCIPVTWVCDGDNDCEDNSDERTEECKSTKACTDAEFRCTNGRCILKNWQCDGENDCPDGSDENPSICRIRRCSEREFECSPGVCITNVWVCDNHEDCADGSDEKNCRRSKNCTAEQFTCRGSIGQCVPLTWMCDDHPDCMDRSDETDCNNTCRADEFTCDNKHCIQRHWVCDHDDDCGDGSDEKDCQPSTCQPDTQFTCAKGYCITSRWRCDGDSDCPDGSDEMGCTDRPPKDKMNHCGVHEFSCDDHITCIRQSWVCDGGRDCPDGADESPSNCGSVTCRPDQFQCSDRSCISGRFFCDGIKNCPDGADEKNCTAADVVCDPLKQFDCGHGSCIPLSSLCDGKPDCLGWEDEPLDLCKKNECLVNNGGCSQICVDLPIGFRCECRNGYRLINNQTCDDVDECLEPGSCSQFCKNEKGTFKCSCDAGYLRDPRDLTRCKAAEGHASLLFARRHDIRKVALDRPEMTAIVNNTKMATALDFVFRTGMIFWSDVSDKKIYKAPIDEGNERTVVIDRDLTTSDGLAVDWIYNHIYWTDAEKNTIELANFEGNMRKTLIKDRVQEPRAIAVNPLEGWMFWTDWGDDARIERAGMDGSHRSIIVGTEVRWPNGLTLDLVGKKLYWVDAKLNKIASCNYDGSGRRTVLYSPDILRHPFSITTFEDYIFWTDWDKEAIFKANKFTGKEVEAITSVRSVQHPMAVHVYHPYRQPDGKNQCQAVNGHCSHLCLPAPKISAKSPLLSCACPDGLRLLPDGLMCVENGPANGTDGNEGAGFSEENTDRGIVAGIVIGVVTVGLAVPALVAFLCYRHYLHRNVTSMNFDNPVYRKTTEDQFSLEKNRFPLPATTVGEEAQEPLTSPGTNDYV
ncbi:very low-density lipoprotein receptor isoform X2 [Neodiprion pinetum]|uniref:very low-density lipoprotein receptor isoform X2 n=1 Tax=Neodiprion pinetum TaxID=441929 RepID=UPI001EE000BA|nr:low-density lipoprotein receptor-like isoform X2 [Neodiprion pinetum]